MTYQSWISNSWALAKDAFVDDTNLLVFRFNLTKSRTWCSVYFMNLVVLLREFHNNSVVCWLPGAINWTWAQISGWVLAPIHWTRFRLLLNCGCASSISSYCILYDWEVLKMRLLLVSLVDVWMWMPLKEKGFCDIGVRRLHLKVVDTISSLYRNCGESRPRESSTFSRTSPSNSSFALRIKTYGSAMACAMPNTSRWWERYVR